MAVVMTAGCRGKGEVPVRYAALPFCDSMVVASTPVKHQGRSGSCWAFGGTALLESDILRRGGDTCDLAEMWIVRNAYLEKAVRYVRTRGASPISEGGELHDATELAARYGVVPQELYGGGTDGGYDHRALVRALRRNAWWIVATRQYRDEGWQERFEKVLDKHLGAAPERFAAGGMEHTPESYAAALGLDSAKFRHFTSLAHRPYGSSFAVEVADNWMGGKAENVPVDTLVALIDSALVRGYTAGWCGTTTDEGFQWRRGVAGVRRGEEITAESRRRAFDTQQLRDGHVMQIVGIAVRDDGAVFYKAKNSWGEENPYGGYIYMSRNYLKKNTILLTVDRRAVPDAYSCEAM